MITPLFIGFAFLVITLLLAARFGPGIVFGVILGLCMAAGMVFALSIPLRPVEPRRVFHAESCAIAGRCDLDVAPARGFESAGV